ncbi:hypothetical protein HQQ80_04690 [Microbacteriaceae bacterium VKM Ac-2855]|nr:hypothetical protein [Microbacteriaceae bacterium VKM Ac-2855]
MATTHTSSTAPSTDSSYTAKLIDGPLEGKTIRTSFLDSGDPQARLELAAPVGSKHYVYLRTGGMEHEEGAGSRPTAVEYRYQQVVAG